MKLRLALEGLKRELTGQKALKIRLDSRNDYVQLREGPLGGGKAMAYKTLKKIRILRYGRWIEVDKDYVLTEKEVAECPNLKAWTRWAVIKEIPDSKKKERRKTLSTKGKTKPTRKSKKTERTSGAKTETKPEDTRKVK